MPVLVAPHLVSYTPNDRNPSPNRNPITVTLTVSVSITLSLALATGRLVWGHMAQGRCALSTQPVGDAAVFAPRGSSQSAPRCRHRRHRHL
jgi:hypothetical protein